MSRGFQLIVVTGHLGADPEVRYTGEGNAIATLRIATSEVWRNTKTGEREEHTEWHRAKVFGKPAEFAGQYLRKGRLVTVAGKVRTERWTAADGGERFTSWIYADTLDAHGAGERSTPDTRAEPRQGGPQQQDDDGAGGDDRIPF